MLTKNVIMGYVVMLIVFGLTSILGIWVVDENRTDARRIARSEIFDIEWENIKRTVRQANRGDLIVYQNEILVLGRKSFQGQDVTYHFSVVSSSEDGNLVNATRSYTVDNIYITNSRSASIGWGGKECNDCHNRVPE
jgi:hypothetical protein